METHPRKPQRTKTVKLTTPVTLVQFGVKYDQIVLEEPNAELYFELGPLSASYIKNGVETASDLEGVLLGYLRFCVKNIDIAHWLLMLREMSLVDALKIRRTFASFFDDAVRTVLLEETAELAKGAMGAGAAA